MSELFQSYQEKFIQSIVKTIVDQARSFYGVCDANDFAIGCALMQYDVDGAERVGCYQ